MNSGLILSKLNISCKSIDNIENNSTWFNRAYRCFITLTGENSQIGEINIFKDNSFLIRKGYFSFWFPSVCRRAPYYLLFMRDLQLPCLNQSIFDIFPPYYFLGLFINFIKIVSFLLSNQLLINIKLLNCWAWSDQYWVITNFMNGWCDFCLELAKLLKSTCCLNSTIVL